QRRRDPGRGITLERTIREGGIAGAANRPLRRSGGVIPVAGSRWSARSAKAASPERRTVLPEAAEA
ncbi:MAG: hypothetical protein K2X11_15690, partial [Acetobacteraceae bacterium]|nr:hypothetical protein [Acetobacteraceae bacterium]